jgi:hypothetical protein
VRHYAVLEIEFDVLDDSNAQAVAELIARGHTRPGMKITGHVSPHTVRLAKELDEPLENLLTYMDKI